MNVEVRRSRDTFSYRRHRKLLALLFPLLCFLHSLQAEEWLWAKKAVHETGTSSARNIVTAPNGAVYVAGYFEGTARFGDFVLSTASNSPTPRSGFLAKYDNAGTVVWAIKNVGAEARGVARDSAGNIYVTGNFSDAAPYGVAPRGSNDVFIAKYAPDSTLVWVTSVGGTSDDASAAIAVDSSSNVFIAGTFNGQAQFGDVRLASSGPADVFVAKFNSSGSVVMATNVGGTAIVQAAAIAVDSSGNPIIAGSFQGSIDFNPDENLTSSLSPDDEPTTDAFVAKLNPAGQWLWARKLASGAQDFGRGVAADSEGNIFFTGSYGSPASTPAGNVFLRKYDPDGNAFWTKTIGGSGDDYATSVSTDQGNAFIAGVFSSSIALGATTLSSSGSSDLFVAKFNGAGNVLWAHRAGGTGNQEIANSIASDNSGNAWIAGGVNGAITFGSTSLSGSVNSTEAFVAKVGSSSPITIVTQPSSASAFVNSNVTFSVVATGSPQTFRWFFNGVAVSGVNSATLTLANVQFAQAGSYRVVITNALGSVTSAPATLVVSELPPVILTQPTNTSAFLGDNVMLSAIVSSALPVTYQWFFNNAPIATGGSGPTLTLNNVQNASAGNYHLVATSASGSATSANAALEVITPPPRIVTQPANASVVLGGAATFSVTVASPIPVSFQWYFNDALILGANSPTLMLDDIGALQAGAYHVEVSSAAGSVASAAAMLEVTIPGPTILTQPASASVVLGSNVTFSVSASSALAITYQWFFNNTPITTGGSGRNLVLNNVQSAQAGNYRVVVSSAAGSVSSANASLQVTIPAPTIVTQPVSALVLLGSNATFSVTASSLLLLSYEWFFNGNPVPNANGATLTLANVETSASGNYSVLVSSAAGAVTSDIATLSVIVPPPVIATQPQSTSVQLGSDATFFVAAESPRPVTYQWFFNGSAIANGGTDAVLNLDNVQTTHAGTYRVVVSSTAGSVTSAPALLQITIPAPTIIAQPSSASVRLGSNVTFSVAASSSLPLTFQWFFNSAPINGGNGSSLTFNNVQTAQAGNYHVVVSSTAGTVTSATATLEVTIPAPTITAQPVSAAVLLGSNATFSVTASSPIPVTYQWFFNGAAIPGAQNSSLVLNNIQSAQAGAYHVVVSSAAGSATSATATLQVTIPTPTISAQPASVSVLLGSNATFSVAASSPVPLSYQWFFNGNPITSGGNGPTLTLNNVQSTQAGAYHVVISNTGGSISSASATLQVIIPPPTITAQPVSASVLLGTNVTLSVTASSALPLTYQWFFNGVPVFTGGNGPALTLNNIQTSQAGVYHVVVSSASGNVTSGNATLQVVIPAPVIVTQPVNAAVSLRGNASFSVVANSPGPLSYQWSFNGAPIATGGNSSTLTLNNVQLANAGSYRVIVSSVGGSVTSSIATLNVQGTAPLVSVQPENIVAAFGTNVTFSTVASGTAPLEYLWLFNGVALATQPRAPALTLTNIQLANEGAYHVVISNAFGTASSSVATLRISGPPPLITTQPAGASVLYGGNVTFNVTASSPLPLSYQWLRNGTPIPNATGPALFLSNLQLAQAGNYSVVVSNVLGTTTSATAVLQVLGSAPVIETQPLSASAIVGESVTFSISASSLLPLTYRWLLNGNPVPNANGSTLTLLNAQTADAGSYHVVVSNALGAVSSAPAELVVSLLPPVIIAQPVSSSVLFGSHATFSVVASGSAPLQYFWFFNGSPIAGSSASSLIVSNAHFTDSGVYSVIVSNAAGITISSNSLLSVSDVSPVIIAQPTNASATVGGSASFSVVASSALPLPLTYQWFYNGVAIAGGNAPTLVLNNVQPAQAGSYYVVVRSESGNVASATITLQVIIPAPTIATQPRSDSVFLGDDVSLSVVATSLLPLTYQWFFNGAPITSGGNAATLTLRNVQFAQAGNYHVVVSSAVGNVSSATATLQVEALPPSIVTQPASVEALAGDNIALSVVATSLLPLTYQWFHNGVAIAGARASTLTLNNVQPAQGGDYRVAVSNVAGVVNSSFATVRVVLLPPTIDAQPASVSAVAGDDITFSVFASSALPLTYQWFRNGVAINGATGATLTLNNVQAAQVGSYHVVVGNSAGNVTSAAAALEVFTPPPTILAQPVSATAIAGDSVTFPVVASSLLPVTYQWFHNEVAIGAGGDAATLTLNNVQPTHAGRYHVVITSAAGSTTSAVVTLDVFVPLPTIVIQPVSASVPLGGNAGLAVGALSPVPLTYQWFFNGSPTTNASALIALENVQVSQAGDYFVVVSNSAGAVTSAVATVQVVVPLPIITSHPASASVLLGSAVTFDVRASSDVPVTYRWFFNGVPVSEPDSSSAFTLTRVQLANAGDYYVVVGNSAGSVRSASARLQVSGAAPRFVNQPVSVDALAGDNISFSVTAASDLPVTYQWYLFDVAIVGATDATLMLSNVQLAQTGNYSVVASNILGTATSAAATLTVADPAPVITTQPAGASLSLGGNVTLFVAASSPLPLTYRWFFNGTAMVVGGDGPTLTLNNVQLARAGDYYVVLSNSAGVVTSAVATVHVTVPAPVIIAQPANASVTVGASVTFRVTASSAVPLTYRWLYNGVPISGAGSSSTLTLTDVQMVQAGNYSVVVGNAGGSTISSPAVLQLSSPAPVITAQPVSASAWLRSNVTFRVTASSTLPLRYRWFHDGAPITIGGTNATLTLTNIQLSHAGEYYVVVSNALAATVSFSATLTVIDPRPVIVAQPESASIIAGESATFSVTALSDVPATYQWYFNGIRISSANAPTLRVNNAHSEQAGNYHVVVSNPFGSVTSTVASLAVFGSRPVITAQPLSAYAAVGSDVTFRVEGSSTLPLSYQWYVNGTPIAGANAPTLTLSRVQLAHSGIYFVVLSNGAGIATSGTATLQVSGSRPAIISQPASVYVFRGANVLFALTASSVLPATYQWFVNGVPINLANASTLTLANVQMAHTGNYYVVVSNAVGTVTSATAKLELAAVPPVILTQPVDALVSPGGSATFELVASSSLPMMYQWYFNGLLIPGAVTNTVTFLNVQPEHAGFYYAIVSNSVGTVTSATAVLAIAESAPIITADPVGATIVAGGTATFNAAATGTGPLTYHWFFNGVPIYSGAQPSITLTNVQLGYAGEYYVTVSNALGTVTSAAAHLQVSPPPPEGPLAVSLTPTNQIALTGSNLVIAAELSGRGPFTCQWWFNGKLLRGQTNAMLILSNIQLRVRGQYQVEVRNSTAMVRSEIAQVAVVTAPKIVSQPRALTVKLGKRVTLRVAAAGSKPFFYQWFKDGLAINQATNRFFTITNAQPGDTALYSVRVLNSGAYQDSVRARLTVVP